MMQNVLDPRKKDGKEATLKQFLAMVEKNRDTL